MSSDGRLQQKFMECRGNQGLEVESGGGGSGWRVREEEVVAVEEKQGERGDVGSGIDGSKERRRRKRVEIRTRVLSYVTPIGGGASPSSQSPSSAPITATTRLRVTGRVVFERAIPVPGLKTVITRAVSEGLRESYGEYRRMLMEEVGGGGGGGGAQEGGKAVVTVEKKTKQGSSSSSSKPLLFFAVLLLLLAALFLLFFRDVVAPLLMQQQWQRRPRKRGGGQDLIVFASVERWLREFSPTELSSSSW